MTVSGPLVLFSATALAPAGRSTSYAGAPPAGTSAAPATRAAPSPTAPQQPGTISRHGLSRPVWSANRTRPPPAATRPSHAEVVDREARTRQPPATGSGQCYPATRAFWASLKGFPPSLSAT
jgi:hypothetical protein